MPQTEKLLHPLFVHLFPVWSGGDKGFTGDYLVTYHETMEEGADVFKALADPTRRAILDLLFEHDGQTAGGLWARFPEMTRFGVSKHVRILEEANLITTARQGRTKLHFLNPVPIAQIAHRWISKYAAPYAGALVDLDQHITSSSS
jgi:DNA-binding transcriptional ArsR family regulator